ncbi:midasin isoform X2 [Aplysia californica]|uniref:Midasin isoform X2 n=1 Tax=Aplysia californica TaxID=6500 RepID=A0ABM1VU60_APLCA|nr:midasin isoform X2 [Aplysia californica]
MTLQATLPRGDRLTIVDMLQVAVSCSLLVKRGVTKCEAFRHAMEDVYVSPRSTLQLKKHLRAAISECLQLLQESGQGEKTLMLWSQAVPGESSWMLQLKANARFLFSQIQEAAASKSSDVPAVRVQLCTAAGIVQSLLSEPGHSLLGQWLDTVWPSFQSALAAGVGEGREKEEVDALLADVRAVLSGSSAHVFESSAWRDLQAAVERMFSSSSAAQALMSELPWDLSHNPQALTHALWFSTSGDGEDPGQEIRTCVQRLQLVQQASAVAQALGKKVQELEKVVLKGGRGTPSALGLILLVLSEMATSLPRLVELLPPEALALSPQHWHRLLWLVRLADVGVSGRGSGVSRDVLTSHLALHWHWLEDKLADLLEHVQRTVPRVAMATDELHRMWSGDDATAKLYGKRLATFGHPRPFLTQRQADLVARLTDIVLRLTSGGVMTSQWSNAQVKTLLQVDTPMKRLIMQLAEKISRDEEDVAQDFSELLATLSVRGLLPDRAGVAMEMDDAGGDATDSGTCRVVEADVTCVGQRAPLWPLFEHMAALVQLCFTVGGLSDDLRSAAGEDDEQLREYLLTHTSQGLDVCVRRSTAETDSQVQSFLKLQDVFELLWACKASHNPTLWLNWSGQDEEPSFEKEDLGPAFLHQPSLSRSAMTVLASGPRLRTVTDLLPLEVHLGQLKEERLSVSGVARHVWCHGPVLGCQTYDVRQTELHLLWFSFIKLLRLLQLYAPPEQQAAWVAMSTQLDAYTPSAVQNNQIWEHILQTVDNDNLLGSMTSLRSASTVRCCIDAVRKACGEGSAKGRERERSADVGRAMALTGLLQAHMLAPRGPVDPVEKAGLKLQHVLNETEEIDVRLSTWDSYLTFRCGRSLADTPTEHVHPEIRRLRDRREQLEKTRAKLEQRKAYRPEPSQFKELCQSVSGFLDSSLSLSRLTDLTHKLSSFTRDDLPTAETTLTTALQEEKVWQDSAQRFLRQLKQKFPLYRDLLCPVHLAIHQVKYGLRLMAHHVECELKSRKLGGVLTLNRLVVSLCSFPSVNAVTPDLLTLATQLSLTSTHNSLASVFHTEEIQKGGTGAVNVPLDAVKSRLLICVLWLMRAHCSSSQRLDARLTAGLFRVFDLFAQAWTAQENRRRQREAEKAALFRYKEETHGDERSEAEREEAEFKAAYPTFDKDFVDVTGADRLEDVGQEAEVPAEDQRVVSLEEISSAEIVTACRIHQELFTSLTSAHWLTDLPRGQGLVQCDLLSPALLAYQLGSELVKRHYSLLGCEADREIMGSHLLVAGSMSQYLESLDSNSVEQLLPPSFSCGKAKKSYNFYYDTNIQEVMKCRPVIDGLRVRVDELQKEWPQHPTLILLQQVMTRILSFPVSCPVVKFLTGLELLLEKAQEWESNAASHVSLSVWLTEITRVIVQWRKLELSCWNSALDTEEENCKVKATQWWLHLYQLTSDHLAGRLTEPAADGQEDSSQDILTSLKKFMESSTLGEYTVRLGMLQAFHCQLLNMEASENQRQLMHMLWNVNRFYGQFEEAVLTQIKQLRAPIEKQLKGFVKIARWSDMNYWALKSSTEKTHRTVHKHIKEYQAVLRQPVQSLLGDKGDNLVVQAVEQSSGFPLKDKIAAFTSTLLKQIDSVKEAASTKDLTQGQSEELPLLSRLPRLFGRLRTHVKKSLKSSPLMGMVVTFDEFCGDLIQEIHDLQGLQVDMSAEKDKQKSEAKAIDMRKRKGLAELFKYLTLIGLSYRKGMTKGVDSALMKALEVAPLDLDSHQKNSTGGLWSGCQNYYYRCISRHAQFLSAMHSPSKELTMADIQRCTGYVEYFSKLYIEHRMTLSEVAGHFMTLRKLMSALEGLNVSSLPPQTEAFLWVNRVKQVTTQLSQALAQFSLVLQSCPGVTPGQQQQQAAGQVGCPHPSPIPAEKLAESCGWVKGELEWEACWAQVQSLTLKVQEQQTSVDKILDLTLIGWSDVSVLKSTLNCYNNFSEPLTTICTQFSSSQNDQSSPFTSSLSYVVTEIKSTTARFSEWLGDIHYNQVNTRSASKVGAGGGGSVAGRRSARGKTDDGVSSGRQSGSDSSADKSAEIVGEFLKKTETLVESVLLSVQGVVQIEAEVAAASVAAAAAGGDGTAEQSSDAATEGQDAELQEAHLTKHLLDRETHLVSQLRCSQTLSKLQDLITDLKGATDQPHEVAPCHMTCAEALCQVQPLLKTYTAAVERQLGCGVLLHRAMGKLLSVLLAVFTELAQKGFCIPPELSEEMEGEGATEFVDAEGGGLGEGQGAKDVSDQIESEDQLDEAKQAGEKQQEDDGDQPDIDAEDNAIEMSDDFGGKLHDMDATDDKNDENDDDKKEEEEDMERQMGDADGNQEERLDERMWGSDDEENVDEEKENKDDEGGGGMDKKEEEMVAKDDNKNAPEANQEEDNEMDRQKEEDTQPNELMSDDEEYDDNKVNPHRPEEDEEETKDLDLGEDLNLEGDQDKDQDNEKDMETEDVQEQENQSEKDEEQAPEADQSEDKDGDEDGSQETPAAEADKDEEAEEDTEVDTNTDAQKPEEEEDGKGEEGASAQEEEDKPTSQLKRDQEEEAAEPRPGQDGDSAQDAGSATNPEVDTTAGEVDQDTPAEDTQDRDGLGTAQAEAEEGHTGQRSRQSAETPSDAQDTQSQRKPGKSDSDRTLGSHDRQHRRLKTTDEAREKRDEADDDENDEKGEKKDERHAEYEHVKDARSQWDAQTVDTATAEQTADKQAVPSQEEEDEEEQLKADEDVKMEEEKEEEMDAEAPEKRAKKAKESKEQDSGETKEGGDGQDGQAVEVEGDRVLTMTVDRAPESSIHTVLEHLHLGSQVSELDIGQLRADLEQCVSLWSHPEQEDEDVAAAASEAWQQYLAVTGSLAQELCEQLRLILEPSQATQLRGDYRTGKRLNMRKVIPYIASQFRKDKIWLRRSKPSKRQYQIMIAVDDSSSMADSHTKQLAFECLALVSTALTLLDAGDLAVCSFGEEVRLLHPFGQPLTSQAGGQILQHLTCDQKQTKYGLLLDRALALMMDARRRQPGSSGNSETAQLLLVLSDGRGVFREGMDTVRRAVRRARAAHVFLVFVVMDNPDQKGSLLEAKVPLLEPSGKVQEIKPYLELFPFPFYIILRDINGLPQVLSDSLRQWFELVTAADR